MWVLLILSTAIGDPPNAHYAPSFLAQEFTTQETCTEALGKIKDGFGSAISNASKTIRENESVGQARSYEDLLFYAECFKK